MINLPQKNMDKTNEQPSLFHNNENPFAKHGIKFLSPSALNLFIESPAKYVMRYLYKIKDDPGSAVWRGTAVHSGVEFFLNNSNASIEDCVGLACESFDKKAGSFINENAKLDREIIEPTLRKAVNGINEFRAKNQDKKYIGSEVKVEMNFKNFPVPVRGFVDMLFENCFLDLKTTKFLGDDKSSSKDVRQVAFYQSALGTNGKGEFLKPYLFYVAPAKHRILPVDEKNAATSFKQLVNAATVLKNFLNLSDDKEKLASVCVPNFDTAYWSERELQEAQKIWKELL